MQTYVMPELALLALLGFWTKRRHALSHSIAVFTALFHLTIYIVLHCAMRSHT
jgi:hypothetical protein